MTTDKMIIGLFLLLGALLVYAYFGTFRLAPTQQQICTLEAKRCPDGSYVSRTGPNCEFAACPSASSTTAGNSCSNSGTCGGTSAATATATSSSGASPGIMPYASGVRGTVTLGPTCPVEQYPPSASCADKPYQTLISIFRQSDMAHAFVITQSDAQGVFSASLPPGDYTIEAGQSSIPRCAKVSVVVGPSAYAIADISCDSGIR